MSWAWTCSGGWRSRAGRRTNSRRSATGRCGCDPGALGAGNRWYKVRVGPHYGLMQDVGVPGFVDPADPSKLWIDWDRAYKEHTEAWDREARVRRAVSDRTENAFDRTLDRLNPFGGKLRPEDERSSRSASRGCGRETAAAREQCAELRRQQSDVGAQAGADRDESAELMRRIEELERIHEVGRKTQGDRRRIRGHRPDVRQRPAVPDHVRVRGPPDRVRARLRPTAHQALQEAGTEVDVWIDPENPDAIVPN